MQLSFKKNSKEKNLRKIVELKKLLTKKFVSQETVELNVCQKKNLPSMIFYILLPNTTDKSNNR